MSRSPFFDQHRQWLFRGVLVSLMLVIGFIYGFQHLLWLHEIQWDYKNAVFPAFFRTPDAYHYIAQTKEIDEGNFMLSNTYIAEYKNTQPSVWPQLPFFLLTGIGKVLHVDIPHLFVLMDFVLPPLSFLFAFALLHSVSSNRKIALFGALVLVLTPHILWVQHLIPTVIRLFMIGPPILIDAHGYHCFSRPINPQLTYPLLMAAMFFFLRYLQTTAKRDAFFCIIFGGLVSYTYVYFSTYLYTFLGLMTIGCLLPKARTYFRSALTLFIATVLISLPFWYSVFSFSEIALTQVSWVYKDHTPIFDSQMLLTLSLVLYIGRKLHKKLIGVLPGITGLAVLLSGFICLNQHVITGLNTQPEWHYNMFIRPQSAILAVSLLVAELITVQRKREGKGASLLWFRKFSPQALLVNVGAGILVISGLLHPSIVAAHFSPDGNLSSQFVVLLQIFCFSGLLLGTAAILMAILIHTKYSVFLGRLSTQSAWFFMKVHQIFTLSKPLQILLGATIIGYFLLDVTLAQYIYYQDYIFPRYSDLQQLAPALTWLDSHTEKESVVLGSLDVASTAVITIYTDNNVYVASHAQFYAVPSLDEFRERVYTVLLVMGVRSRQDFELIVHNKNEWNYVFLENSGLSYEDFQKKMALNIYSELTRYQIDYVFYGPREKQSFKIDPEQAYPFLQTVYDDGIVKIFAVL